MYSSFLQPTTFLTDRSHGSSKVKVKDHLARSNIVSPLDNVWLVRHYVFTDEFYA